jgi:GNAT superfamily N-acetyltransferase
MRHRTISDLPPFLAWEQQAPQYDIPENPHHGTPGLHFWQVPKNLCGGVTIFCLLHYGDDGQLDAIMNYYPKGTPLDEPGDFLILVRPDRQRQRIGTAVLGEAIRRWNVRLDDQCVTPAGEAFLSYLEATRA